MDPRGLAPLAPGAATGAPQPPTLEALAYTCALDLCAGPDPAIDLAKELLKDVRKSGLKSPFAEALLRRLALAEWAARDRPRPLRVDMRDPKESAVLLFFRGAWGVTYEDLGVALHVSEDRSRHLVHKARMDRIATFTRIPIPTPACRRPRELLSDFREGVLAAPLAHDVTQHLKECRDCSALDLELRNLISAPDPPLSDVPVELAAKDPARPTLSSYLDAFSRSKRRMGIGLLVVGLGLTAVEFHPGLNAAATDQMDRMVVVVSRWRNRGERMMEDLRVLRALAIGTLQGRTEELGQTLEEYVNSGNSTDSTAVQNKPATDAVSAPEGPKNQLRSRETPEPATGSLSPTKP